MNSDLLLKRALNFEFLSIEEGKFLFETAPTSELMYVANELRKLKSLMAKLPGSSTEI